MLATRLITGFEEIISLNLLQNLKKENSGTVYHHSHFQEQIKSPGRTFPLMNQIQSGVVLVQVAGILIH